VDNALSILSGKWMSGHERYIRAYVDGVLNDKSSPVSPEDAYENVRVLEQICRRIPNA
jgi:hypothetical protein